MATPTQPGSDLQNFGARRGFELASVHRHSQHAVIADGAGQLDEALITEPLPQCAGARLVDPVLAEELPREVDDFRVFRRNAARVVFADRRDLASGTPWRRAPPV